MPVYTGTRTALLSTAPAWSPLDLGAGLLAWYKADSLSQADGSAVTDWPDSSGNGRTASEATNTPTFETNELGGYPVIRFDATNDVLTTASVTHGVGTGDLAIIGVAKTNSAYTFGGALIFRLGTAAHARFMYHSDTGPNLMSGNFNITTDKRFNDNLGLSSWRTVVYTRVGTALSMYYNGTQDSDTGNTSGDFVGTGAFIFGPACGTDVAEMIAYKGTLSTDNRIYVQNYLRAKYKHY